MGNDLIQAMRIPKKLLEESDSSFEEEHPKTLRLAQSLWFLRSWFPYLAITKKDAILWAGFWTDPKVG